MPDCIYSAWKNRSLLTKPDKLFVVWAIVVVLFFSVSKSTLPGYILTVTVALGILFARLFSMALNNSASQYFAIIRHGVILLAFFSILGSGLVALSWYDPNFLIEYFPRAKALQFENYLSFLPCIFYSFLAVAFFSVISLHLNSTHLIFTSFISVALLLMTVNFSSLVRLSEILSTKALAEKLPVDLPVNTQLACLECLPNGLPFYTKRLITVLTTEGEEFTSNYVKFSLRSSKPWPTGIVPVALAQNWLENQRYPVYLMARSDKLVQLEAIAKHNGLTVTALGLNYRAVFFPVKFK